MAIKSGIKLVGGKGASVLRSVTENGSVVQKAVSKGGVTKVVTFAEGSPMRKLGITDSVYTSHRGDFAKYYKDEIAFYCNPSDRRVGIGGFCKVKERVFSGSLEKAKGFLEAIRELVDNGGKIIS